MDIPANHRPRVVENKIIHIKRSLSGKGKLSIRAGEEVIPSDILGNYEVNPGFFTVELASKLGVPKKDVTKYLQRSMGSKIYKGELLALRKGLIGQKLVTAPTDGVLEQYNEQRGELELKLLPKVVPLTSGVFGIVDAVSEPLGEVIIKTTATEVSGVLGSGKERGGLLNVLGGASGFLPENKIVPTLEGQILVTGSLILSDVLKKAAKLGVYGIITGGINARDFKSMVGTLNPYLRLGNDAGIGLIATEGYGSLPIGPDIFNYLKSYQGKFVILIGNSGLLILPSSDPDCIMKLRKVALPISKEPDSNFNIEVKEVQIGSKVRIIWPPYAGSQGKVVGIDQSATTLASGISTFLLTVEIPGRKLKVPSSNIEII